MTAGTSKASLRWQLLRHHLLPSEDCPHNQELTQISRRPYGHFGLITIERMNQCEDEEDEWHDKRHRSIIVKYRLPTNPVVDLVLIQRKEDGACFSDFAYAKENQIDMTGLVGLWPAEEVLAHFCITNPSLFRNKRVLELGSGYGLGGLATAACTEAAEVVLTDGNPQIIESLSRLNSPIMKHLHSNLWHQQRVSLYPRHLRVDCADKLDRGTDVNANIRRNKKKFGTTEVKAHLLHWCDNVPSVFEHSFEMVIAADCTFFSDSHLALARSVKRLLRKSCDSQALFFNPQRDGSLNAFLQTASGLGLSVELQEHYDASVWSIHQNLLEGETSGWCNYDTDHCYALLAVLSHLDTEDRS